MGVWIATRQMAVSLPFSHRKLIIQINSGERMNFVNYRCPQLPVFVFLCASQLFTFSLFATPLESLWNCMRTIHLTRNIFKSAIAKLSIAFLLHSRCHRRKRSPIFHPYYNFIKISTIFTLKLRFLLKLQFIF